MNVVISREVVNDLNNLVTILFEKDYFYSKASSQNYVNQIYDFLEFDLINHPHKNTPKNLKRYGPFYVFLKVNTNTTWYIFFNKNESYINITHLTNNHLPDINMLNLM